MKTTGKYLTVAILFFAPLALAAQEKHQHEEHAQHAGMEKTVYVCPMNCENGKQYDHAGNCPKCGMSLKKQTLNGEKPEMKGSAWTCSMHPDVLSDHAGNCPKCGMKLIRSKTSAQDKTKVEEYSCPMHPEVTSHKKGTCGICGMELVKAKKQ